MTAGLSRREALHWLGAATLVAGLSPGLAGCAQSEAECEAGLRDALHGLGGLAGAALVAEAAGLSRADAATALCSSDRPSLLATSTGVGLHRWLAARREADLAAGRVRFVRGWLLTETEIAAAVLLSG